MAWKQVYVNSYQQQSSKGQKNSRHSGHEYRQIVPVVKVTKAKKTSLKCISRASNIFSSSRLSSPFLSNTTAISSLQPVHDLEHFYVLDDGNMCLEELPVMNRGALCGDNQTHRIRNSPCLLYSIKKWGTPCECTLLTLYIIREEPRVQIFGKSRREHNTHISLQTNKNRTSVPL